ncbi:MAG: response regulator, partial [Chloroflexota bacterium]
NNLANRLVHVTDGQMALDFLFAQGAYEERSIENQPKVVLLDLKLPKVDGLSVLKEAKSDPRTKFIPIVVLTSSKEEQDLIESYKLGVNSYIVKPVDFDRFIVAVRDLGMYWLLLNEALPNGNSR